MNCDDLMPQGSPALAPPEGPRANCSAHFQDSALREWKMCLLHLVLSSSRGMSSSVSSLVWPSQQDHERGIIISTFIGDEDGTQKESDICPPVTHFRIGSAEI